MEEDILTTYKIFCHDSSERILKDVGHCVGTIHEEAGENDKGSIMDALSRLRAPLLRLISVHFFQVIWQKASPLKLCWEKEPPLEMAISLFEEYSNMMIAAIKNLLSRSTF